jgi:hypothetical protein
MMLATEGDCAVLLPCTAVPAVSRERRRHGGCVQLTSAVATPSRRKSRDLANSSLRARAYGARGRRRETSAQVSRGDACTLQAIGTASRLAVCVCVCVCMQVFLSICRSCPATICTCVWIIYQGIYTHVCVYMCRAGGLDLTPQKTPRVDQYNAQ